MGKPSPQLSTGPPQSRGGALRAGDILLAAARMWVLPPLQPAHLPPPNKKLYSFPFVITSMGCNSMVVVYLRGKVHPAWGLEAWPEPPWDGLSNFSLLLGWEE